MKTVILFFAKRYIVSALNDLMQKYKGNVTKASEVIGVQIVRLQAIVEQLKRINEWISDGKVEDEEIDDSISEMAALVKEF